MNKKEFIQVCINGGYAEERTVKKYIEKSGKTEFTDNDIVELYHEDMHWYECCEEKGMRYVFSVNGKTTAMNNGIVEDSGERQDWW